MGKHEDKILNAINKQAERQSWGFWDYFMLVVFLCTMGFVLLLLLAL
ncbi:MAG: hypothetical protein OXG54_05760 [Gammaproteobacteria bacterium]|nr:hypothetical protein [Gammaproteobacteria bacterium]